VREAPDGLYIILVGVGEEHRIWIPNPPAKDAPLAASISLDDVTESRAAAAIRFYRSVIGATGATDPCLGQQRTKRLQLALRALDGWRAGAAYRDIALELFGSPRLAAQPWKTAAIRDTTIRLVRTGRQMMSGGYRDLLLR
jgi:hypothetical protein